MTENLTRYEALKRVREAYGSQEAMALALAVSQSTVSRWLGQSKQLPAEYVLQAEAETGVSRHWLRPDIYPHELLPGDRFIGLDQGFGRVSFERRDVSQPTGRRAVA